MANRYMGIWEEGVMAVVTRVITFVKTHTIVHLKFTKTLQQCRIRNLFNFSSPRAYSSRLHPFSP